MSLALNNWALTKALLERYQRKKNINTWKLEKAEEQKYKAMNKCERHDSRIRLHYMYLCKWARVHRYNCRINCRINTTIIVGLKPSHVLLAKQLVELCKRRQVHKVPTVYCITSRNILSCKTKKQEKCKKRTYTRHTQTHSFHVQNICKVSKRSPFEGTVVGVAFG